MGRVTVDFSDVQDFEPLEKGEYSAVIENATWVEPSQEDKSPYINLELILDEPGFEGRKAWMIWSLSPKALFRMKGDLENLGIIDEDDEIDIDYDEDADPPVVTEPEVIGLPVVLVCDKPRTFEGRQQNNPQMLRAPENGGKKSSKSDEKKSGTGGKKKFK